jgi:hypothetical protein
VSIEEVANTLEEQGIASFAKSWDELVDSVAKQIEKAGAVVLPAGAVKPATGENGQAPRAIDDASPLSASHIAVNITSLPGSSGAPAD